MRIEIWSDIEGLDLDGIDIEIPKVEQLNLNDYMNRAKILCAIEKAMIHMMCTEEEELNKGVSMIASKMKDITDEIS